LFRPSRPEEAKQIRAFDFVLDLDGSVEAHSATQSEPNKPSSQTSIPPHGSEQGLLSPNVHAKIFPSRYRIPLSTISDLDLLEKTQQAEDFALGSLLYEAYTTKPPFPELTDSEIQARYRNADFPSDVGDIGDGSALILSCWSREFANALKQRDRESCSYNLSPIPLLQHEF